MAEPDLPYSSAERRTISILSSLRYAIICPVPPERQLPPKENSVRWQLQWTSPVQHGRTRAADELNARVLLSEPKQRRREVLCERAHHFETSLRQSRRRIRRGARVRGEAPRSPRVHIQREASGRSLCVVYRVSLRRSSLVASAGRRRWGLLMRDPKLADHGVHSYRSASVLLLSFLTRTTT